MEVKLVARQIPNLQEFVSHLTRTMHSSLPASLVIWWVLCIYKFHYEGLALNFLVNKLHLFSLYDDPGMTASQLMVVLNGKIS